MTTPIIPPQFAGPRPTSGGPSEDWELLKVFVERWRLLVLLPLVFALVAGLLTFLIPPTYTASTTFVTAGQRDMNTQMGGFALVASQLGVGVPTNPTNSPQFFGDVLRSRGVMHEVLRSRMPDPRAAQSKDSVAVEELYAPNRRAGPERADKAIVKLTRESSVSVNPRTNIIELRVSSRYPAAAAFVARRFLTALNRFNLETRQSEARERRRFVEQRLREAQDSLAQAERIQQQFLEANRGDFRSAPTLQAQYDRIQRMIQTYQDLYTNFRHEFETARVDEINDTPVITVIDTAAVPLKKSAPRLWLLVVAGGMLGIVIAVAMLLVQGYLERLRRYRPDDYDQIRELRRIFLRTLGVRRPTAA